MLSHVASHALSTFDAFPVTVEVLVSKGKNKITLIGLGDSAVSEAKDRVSAALRNLGVFLEGDILVNLAPAELKKEGSSLDLPIAIGILAAIGKVPREPLKGISFHGELSLDGSIKGIRGSVAFALEALREKQKALIVPLQNASEGALVSNVKTYGARSLREVVQFLRGEGKLEIGYQSKLPKCRTESLDDVWGQERAKRTLLIAASGGHNLLMLGPPGCGKSMLASRLPSILPSLDTEEILEVGRVYSGSGLPFDGIINGERPYRAPHHTISEAGLVGGGSPPKPGEVTFAHRGVLFLDELPEFKRGALEALRAPLEAGRVTIARSKGRATLPASFQLVTAMNPCPCGRLGVRGLICLCGTGAINTYLKKISEPLLDRIDLHVELEAVPLSALGTTSKSSESVSSKVEEVWSRCTLRQGKRNSLLTGEEIWKMVEGRRILSMLLEKVTKSYELSARAITRVLRVARTIADLESAELITENHVAEAISFRGVDRIRKLVKAA